MKRNEKNYSAKGSKTPSEKHTMKKDKRTGKDLPEKY